MRACIASASSRPCRTRSARSASTPRGRRRADRAPRRAARRCARTASAPPPGRRSSSTRCAPRARLRAARGSRRRLARRRVRRAREDATQVAVELARVADRQRLVVRVVIGDASSASPRRADRRRSAAGAPASASRSRASRASIYSSFASAGQPAYSVRQSRPGVSHTANVSAKSSSGCFCAYQPRMCRTCARESGSAR